MWTSSARRAKAAEAAPGLTFPRFFTEAGVDPFDEVEWEQRAALIGNERGELVFEQRDVENPRNSGRSRRPTSSSQNISVGRSARRNASTASSS